MAASTARKRSAGSAASRRSGPRITGNANALNLDAMLAERVLDPAPITLFGKEWKIRRDLSPAEAVAWLQYMEAPKVTVQIDGGDFEVEGEAAAWGLLLGDMALGREMNDALGDIPREHVRIVANEVIRLAGLTDLVGGSGEALGERSAS